MEVIRPGQVVKLPTSERRAELLRAAGHWGWCVFGVIFEWLGHYWFAPGAQPHLHLPGVTEGRGSAFKSNSAGHAGELKV